MTTILYDYYVERIGKGEPTLFLPAAGFSGNEGLNIAEHLQEDYETHMIDLPGLGKSAGLEGKVTSLTLANWVNEYMEQQQIHEANLIGHSLGGAIALAFAVHYPSKVNKLILLDQGHKPFPKAPTSEFGPFAYLFPFLNLGVQSFGQPFLRQLAPLFMKGDEQKNDIEKQIQQFCQIVDVEESEYIRTAMKHQGDFSVNGLNLMFGYYNLNLPKLLKQLSVPTYLVYGTFKGLNEKEYNNTYHYIRKIQKHDLPVTYRAVKGGHYVNWSSEWSINELEDFLTIAE
ncbi:alpha/beta hydrolase [Halobacillus locisalis]|uniref:Alpha/beta hydrolase n=1 Tax=Halobacillus locisalis TaxID=220753 RepID=A0A838CVY0_9BACI|nr:alpha/beta hydrolase [Halobacillus locisalis]MBA2176207.1 alpha/beta hydrolase [Halobacillus locisalis]